MPLKQGEKTVRFGLSCGRGEGGRVSERRRGRARGQGGEASLGGEMRRGAGGEGGALSVSGGTLSATSSLKRRSWTYRGAAEAVDEPSLGAASGAAAAVGGGALEESALRPSCSLTTWRAGRGGRGEGGGLWSERERGAGRQGGGETRRHARVRYLDRGRLGWSLTQSRLSQGAG